MSFPIALLLSLSFSTFFIVRDRRPSSFRSLAIWLPTIWLMLAFAKPLSYWISPGSFSGGQFGLDNGSGSPIDRGVLSFLMAIALLELLQRRLDWRALWKQNSLLIVVFIYLAMSIAWSVDKPIATKRLFRGLGDVMMALIIITEPSPLEAVSFVVKRLAFILLPLSLVLIKYFRGLGVVYDWDGTEMWVGVTLQKNSLGILSCVVAMFFAMEIVKTWRKKLPVVERFTQFFFLALALYLLIKSRSATSLGALILGVALYVLSYRRRDNASSVGRLYFVLLLGAVIVYYTMLPLLVAAMGRDMTFTSRTVIWDGVYQVGIQHPILGVGYGSLWTGRLGSALWAQLHVNEAHNGYLEIFATLGIVGLFLTAIMILQVFRNIMTTVTTNFMFAIFRIVYLVIILVDNITESSLLITTSKLWILFLFVGMEPPRLLVKENPAPKPVTAIE